jgi:GntR family transcriptional regulator, histidine utilization repressor
MSRRREQLPAEFVRDALLVRLRAGEWSEGDALPPVARLARVYGCSPSTVNKALHELAADGYVRPVARWGWFRTERPVPPSSAG